MKNQGKIFEIAVENDPCYMDQQLVTVPGDIHKK